MSDGERSRENQSESTKRSSSAFVLVRTLSFFVSFLQFSAQHEPYTTGEAGKTRGALFVFLFFSACVNGHVRASRRVYP